MRNAAIVLGISSLWLAAGSAEAQLDLEGDAAGSAAGAATGQVGGAAGQIGGAAGGAAGGRVGGAPGQIGGAAGGQVGGAAGGQLGGIAADGEIQSALNQQMRISGVTSEIRNGVATLHGTVKTQAEKDRAGQVARRVDGVTRVRNEITVAGDASAAAHAGSPVESAGSIDTVVLANLNAEGQFAGRGIQASSSNGSTVTLTGEVSSEAEKARAGRIAAETQGVTKVENHLVVRKK